MSIGIIGAGSIGSAFARALARHNIAATIANRRGPGIDLGPLAVGGRLVQFPGGPLPALNLVKFD
jgi:hypothetical protein